MTIEKNMTMEAKLEKLEGDWTYLAKVYGVDADDTKDVKRWLDENPYDRREFLEDIKAYNEFKLQAAPEKCLGCNIEAMKDFATRVGGQMLYHNFRFIEVMKQNGIEEHQKGVVAVKDGKVYKTFLVRITSVEDRGDFYYVGFSPRDYDFGSFGYTRVYKEPGQEYGTLGVKRVNASEIEF